MAPPREDGFRKVQQSKASLSIVERNINELKLDPGNPRRHSKKQVRQIAKSIEAFGFNVPVTVDEHLQVVNGHGRLAAARLLGMQQVPTICIAHLSESQRRAFQIADNRLAENSRWNRAALAETLQILQTSNLNFDVQSTGFEITEINSLTLGFEATSAQPKKHPKELPKTPPELPVTVPGDIWVLRDHRLVCGSAFDAKDYALLMNGRRAAAVLTSVPTAISDDVELLSTVFSELAKNSDATALQFFVGDFRFIRHLGAAERGGLKLVDTCVAVKPHADAGPVYQNQHHLIFVFENTAAEPSSKPQISRSNVWFYPGTRAHRTSELNKADLIQKSLPERLISDAITDSTVIGGIVLDPFLHTATTLTAAEEAGRICYAIASNPIQLDQAVRRWQQLSGQTAAHEKCGLSFDRIGEERHGRA